MPILSALVFGLHIAVNEDESVTYFLFVHHSVGPHIKIMCIYTEHGEKFLVKQKTNVTLGTSGRRVGTRTGAGVTSTLV